MKVSLPTSSAIKHEVPAARVRARGVVTGLGSQARNACPLFLPFGGLDFPRKFVGRTTVVTNPADIVVGRRHTVNLVGRFT